MVLQVGLVHHVVDKASGVGHACCVGCRVGTVERKVEVEVGIFLLDAVEVVEIEYFVERTRTIEIVHRTVGGMQGLCHVHDLRTQRSHTGTTAYPDHLGFLCHLGRVFLDMELAIGTRHDDLVARLEGEDIRRSDTGIDIHEARTVGFERRRSDTHGQHEYVAFGRIVGHRIGAHGGFGVHAVKVKHLEFLPRRQIFCSDKVSVKVGIIDFERRNLDLRIGARDEIHVLAGRQLHLELLDEGCHVAVGDNRTFVLLDAEDRLRNGNLHILLHLHLAAQTPMVLDLLAGEESHFCGKNGTAAFQHTTFALSARTLATTSRRKVYLLLGKCRDKCVARGHFQFFIVIDGDGHVALRDELGAQDKQHCHQDQDDHQENIKSLFENDISAISFLENIHKEKPRYYRDQLGVIKKLFEEWECEIILKGLEYCINHSLYSAGELKSSIMYLNEINSKSDEVKLSSGLPDKYHGDTTQIRDLSEYDRIMGGVA